MQTQCGGKKEPNCLPLSVKPMISFFQMTMLQTIPEDYQSPENTNIPKLTEADPPRSFLHTLPIVNEFSCGHCDLAQIILQMLQFPILPPSLSQKSSCKDFFSSFCMDHLYDLPLVLSPAASNLLPQLHPGSGPLLVLSGASQRPCYQTLLLTSLFRCCRTVPCLLRAMLH